MTAAVIVIAVVWGGGLLLEVLSRAFGRSMNTGAKSRPKPRRSPWQD